MAGVARWSSADLVTIGWFVKRFVPRPEWLQAPAVELVCSVSECVSSGPDGWLERWLHNALFLFDSAELLERVLPPGVDHGWTRVLLRALPVLFDLDVDLDLGVGRDEERALPPVAATPQLPPPGFVRLGYDVCTRYAGSSIECSPLSCNGLAAELGANRYCLLDDLAMALRLPRRFAAGGAEPGPYLVVEVWAERDPLAAS